ncbi:hypothetical protein M409DRAFT_56086 [Zasmidium cellare ATCC 36951]|uniref:Secreted protein n=1 Tax=Zasmidium cellare ATCC 36951 TaxID=1080233 RepID=A0A6A6CDR3_ZASCE|nr:uncharacterized protein M409DRAFT_56086 [Zasmidium cellare ATCC 36951]KAF2165211.1 hypothetical protein M409DRAFT_56086 [Zasmidium cellare ATCC 36951]
MHGGALVVLASFLSTASIISATSFRLPAGLSRPGGKAQSSRLARRETVDLGPMRAWFCWGRLAMGARRRGMAYLARRNLLGQQTATPTRSLYRHEEGVETAKEKVTAAAAVAGAFFSQEEGLGGSANGAPGP